MHTLCPMQVFGELEAKEAGWIYMACPLLESVEMSYVSHVVKLIPYMQHWAQLRSVKVSHVTSPGWHCDVKGQAGIRVCIHAPKAGTPL